MLYIAIGRLESEPGIPVFPDGEPEELENIWHARLDGVNGINHLLNRVKKNGSGPMCADRGKSGRIQALKRGAFGS